MESNNRASLGRTLAVLGVVASVALALFSWKTWARGDDPPPADEPREIITIAKAEARRHSRSTTAIGTVVAAHSITLRNEVPGTVARVVMAPGAIVNAGDLLLALDVSLERAELASFEAQSRLAQARLARFASLAAGSAVSKMDVETAHAETEVAQAQVHRVQALIARKTLRAPFRARVGITDLDVGQYLAEGELLTTLQSIDARPFVDFRVAQTAALELNPGAEVSVTIRGRSAIPARVLATDSLVDAASRSVMVRAQLLATAPELKPGSAVSVSLPTTQPREVVTVPRSAVRRGPDGDFVFVIQADDQGVSRARQQRVTVDSVDDEVALVSAGLAPGSSVAATGSFKLRDAMAVAEERT
jgi:membrane fusion protein, multidrug efflux system